MSELAQPGGGGVAGGNLRGGQVGYHQGQVEGEFGGHVRGGLDGSGTTAVQAGHVRGSAQPAAGGRQVTLGGFQIEVQTGGGQNVG